MKRIALLFVLSVLALTGALAGACGPKPAPAPQRDVAVAGAPSQDGARDPALPLWKAVAHGVLPNGLTYFVLPHQKPEKRAMMWLAVNAGAVDEDEDQRGLAHLVEHMAFNGTKRFPKQAIVNYVESIGVKFGPDLNAYTSFDETVYQLQVPTDDPAMVAKGFDILRDWAGDVSFEPVEVDKERGVVLEEWRLGRGFQQRMIDKLITVVFGDSRYGKRLPIGLPAVIEKAPRDKLVSFYKDWYRPDLMAVIVVGDFSDAKAIEQQIAKTFGDLPKAAKPRAKVSPGVPAASGTRVAIETDKELPVSIVGIGNLGPQRRLTNEADFRRGLAEQLYQLMLNERLQTIGRRPDAPYALAGVAIEKLTRQVEGFARFAIVKGDDAEGALRSLLTEALRVERNGFVPSELERARAIIVRNHEQAVAEAATRNSRELVAELVRHFLTGELVIGPEAERDLALALLPKITVKEVEAVGKSFGGAESRVIVVAGPDGKPMPAKDRVLAIVDEVGRSTIAAWEDAPAPAKLMDPPAWPGAVEKETKLGALGAVEWTLGNGMRVIVKPTDFEKDAVTIAGSSPGGLAMATDKEYADARFADEIAEAGGAGELDADALGKALAGKRVAVSASIDDVTESIHASGSARDLETMLQLVYLRMSAPRRDEKAFAVWKTNRTEALANAQRTPDVEFAKQVTDALWQGHARKKQPEAADVAKVDLDRALAFYRGRFADAADFTFVIVGAVDLDKLKPLVGAYLGSLPAPKKPEKERDAGARRVPGVVKKSWKLGQDQDKARVQLLFHDDEAWTRDRERDMFILGHVLSIRLREVLREDLSGVYGVGAGGGIARSPRQERTFTIQFGCAPGAVDKLVAAALAEIATIAKSGIGPDYLEKVKQSFVRERETGMRTNAYWSDWLLRAARYGDDPALVLDPAPVIARMTSDHVKAAAARYLDGRRFFQAVMLPGAAK
ncbi:MAG: insulinase family protein [Deltaproteobacteria bacterium]|nr:insulinase family protein [Deltaproteobacteria bacterium]